MATTVREAPAKEAYRVEFRSGHAPVVLERGAELSERLTPENSPVLFGCRTGICATCLVRVEPLSGELPGPGPDEAELLRIVAASDPKARLACQLKLRCDIRIEPIAQ